MNKGIDLKAAWNSKELKLNKDWVNELIEIEEINAALKVAKNSQKSLFQLEKEDFPLPTISRKIPNFLETLENGTGVLMVRGFPINSYSYQEQQIIFWCIGLHIGIPVSQSNIGELMMDIKYAGKNVEQKELRGLESQDDLTYHTDLADVVGMFSLQNAKSGGDTMLVSSIAVHNEILKTRPELLDVLYQPYYHESPPWDSSKIPLELRPIFSVHKNKFLCSYVRPFIDSAQENRHAPTLTGLQTEALNYFDKICNDPRFSVNFILQPGDMLFFNNFVILHSRKAFENDTTNHRHLLRLWLSVSNSRELPDSYKVGYRETRPGAVRGGIHG